MSSHRALGFRVQRFLVRGPEAEASNFIKSGSPFPAYGLGTVNLTLFSDPSSRWPARQGSAKFGSKGGLHCLEANETNSALPLA
jgi:hypothetical protein